MLGALLMLAYNAVAPALFRGETLHGTPAEVLEQTEDAPSPTP